MKSLLKRKQPKIGKIVTNKNTSVKNKQFEIQAAKWLISQYGGNYIILSESKIPNIKTPDLLRNGNELFEIKKFTTMTSYKNRLSEAIKQLLYKYNKIAKINSKFVLMISEKTPSSLSRQEIIKETRLRLSGQEMSEITGVIVKIRRVVLEITK